MKKHYAIIKQGIYLATIQQNDWTDDINLAHLFTLRAVADNEAARHDGRVIVVKVEETRTILGAEFEQFNYNGHIYVYDNEKFILYNANADIVAHYEPANVNDEYNYFISEESGEVMQSIHENEILFAPVRTMLAGLYENQ